MSVTGLNEFDTNTVIAAKGHQRWFMIHQETGQSSGKSRFARHMSEISDIDAGERQEAVHQVGLIGKPCKDNHRESIGIIGGSCWYFGSLRHSTGHITSF